MLNKSGETSARFGSTYTKSGETKHPSLVSGPSGKLSAFHP